MVYPLRHLCLVWIMLSFWYANVNGVRLNASEIMAKLNLKPNPEGGFYAETFRDTSIFLSTSQLPPRYKIDRPISTAIYFFLPSGNVSLLHRIPSAETWHFYLGEPLTILELNDTDGSVKLTCVGQDISKNQQVQYTVPPDVWFGVFPTRDYDILKDNTTVVKNAARDAEKHFSLVGTTVAPAFEFEDFVLAERSELISRYPYIAVVINFSQMWALYCLVKFYHVTRERLQPIRPLAKFISFKAIVFATWWQGVGIALLCYLQVLPNQGRFQTELQDFLICIEMAIAAAAHVFVFSAKPYHFLPASEYEELSSETTKEVVKVTESDEEKPDIIEKTETKVEAPGTSVKESVQDIVVEGGQHVVEDVKLTINQAIGPVGKGMTKIQETIHHLSVGDNDDEKKSEVEVDEYEQDITKVTSDDNNENLEVKIEKNEQVVRVETQK